MKKPSLLLAVVLILPALRCASVANQQAIKSTEAGTTQPVWTSGTPSSIGAITASQDLEKIAIELSADGPMMYTSYNPDSRVLIVDMPNAKLGVAVQDLIAPNEFIESAKLREIVEHEQPLTRLELRTNDALPHRIEAQGNKIRIEFDRVDSVEAARVTDRGIPALEQAVTETTPSASRSDSNSPALLEPKSEPPAVQAVVAEPARDRDVNPASRLDEITQTAGDGSVAVVLAGNGSFSYNAFSLENPPRLVIDLEGVHNDTGRKFLAVGAFGLSKVRVSQFQTEPTPVARVVFDLDGEPAHRILRVGDTLQVVIGPGAETAGFSMPVESLVESSVESLDTTTQEPAPVEEFAAADPHLAPAPAADAATTNDVGAVHAGSLESPPLFEAADVVMQDQGIDPPMAPERAIPVSSFERKDIEGEEMRYTGELISLRLKDADIKDVLNTFSEITGLNMAIDPGVRGTVTVNFENIPWDQALEIILKQNSLGYVLDGNVMRIAPVQRLQAEEKQRRALVEERELSVAAKTVLKPLSYAKASDIATVAKSVMSKRGRINIDKRTNTLVINEIPQFMPTVLKLIEELDTPTPQVLIEARIVETGKNFDRQLGIRWSATGAADVEHGNTTGLQFPYSINGGGGVNLPVVGEILSLTLGNVLGSFQLDVALSAAENRGLVKILSAPKVTTLTNEAASIQTGIQIPVQTTSNSTTSVSYINATLRLEVTPQITAEGTVIMDIHVQKKEPIVGFLEVGGRNVPLSTRDADTKMMVKDGGTAVIGGIYQLSENNAESRIPFLSDIPILGLLFKNHTKEVRHQELLIFITPRIIKG